MYGGFYKQNQVTIALNSWWSSQSRGYDITVLNFSKGILYFSKLGYLLFMQQININDL